MPQLHALHAHKHRAYPVGDVSVTATMIYSFILGSFNGALNYLDNAAPQVVNSLAQASTNHTHQS
jgi:FlaG/FlaF family flagellin (archaellin)